MCGGWGSIVNMDLSMDFRFCLRWVGLRMFFFGEFYFVIFGSRRQKQATWKYGLLFRLSEPRSFIIARNGSKSLHEAFC
jgi:hypothetical protein